ncbi:hypothetical protein QEN19_001915 [Hanseniaspora menglaensis]
MRFINFIASVAFFVLITSGFFFNQQEQQHHHQQQPEEIDYQKSFLGNTHCAEYLCPVTLKCVKSHLECPCPYPDSQMKCIISENKVNIDYLCISKPFLADNAALQAIYDDPNQGHKLRTKGIRDCGWAEDAYFGRA